VNEEGERKGRGMERKRGEEKGMGEDGMSGEARHPIFSDGLTPLDRLFQSYRLPEGRI